MNGLLANIISRPRTVLSMLAFLLFSGTLTYVQIPKEAEPDLKQPIVIVNVALEGVSPVDAERLLVRPLEEQFSNLDDLKEIRATAVQGGATVTIEFEPGVDVDVAMQNVRNKTDMARGEMPQEMEEPRLSEVDLSFFPVIVAALYGDAPERSLLKYARELRDRIAATPGVLKTEITGNREELVEIVIDPSRVQSYRLNSDDLARVFSRANRLVAAGMLDNGQGSFSVTVPGLFESAEDILNLPVKVSGNAVVRVQDIADIRRTFKDAESIVRVDGKRAVAIEVRKRTGANIIKTAEAVRRVIEETSAPWPDSLLIKVIGDGSLNIKEQFYTLQNSVLLAVFLVMAIVIAALGVRSGLLVGIAIPGSFLTGIMVLGAFGNTVNVVVMFGLIISVGMLVDGAIVVTEYADRKMAEGLDRGDAYVLAAQRMAWPIISSTATTIAAFLPLLFWPGVIGQMMNHMPITLICVLSASMVMALVFVPSLGRMIGRVGDADPESMSAISGEHSLDKSKLKFFTRAYVETLNVVLHHPAKAVGSTIFLLFLSAFLYVQFGNGIAFFPKQEPRRAVMLIHARGNLAVEEKAKLIGEVEQRILGLSDFDNLYSRTGTSGDATAADVIGQITLNFKAWQERRKAAEVLREVDELTKDIPGVNVEFEANWTAGVQGKPVQVELSSVYPGPLTAAVAHIRKGLDELGGFAKVQDTTPLPGIEWRLEVDRAQAARFGADLTSVGNAVRLITNGLKLGTYRPDDSDDEIDIVVRYPLSYRSLAQLDELRIQTNNGLVPISNFVRRVPVQQETEISRVDRKRILFVESDVEEGRLVSDQVQALKAWLVNNPVDQRVRLSFKGEQEQQEESSNFLLFAFALAMFLMAAILLIQFNSFYSVLLILSSVILSTIGVLLGYLLTGQPFVVVMSGIGIIALAGIVVNNNIVLIDTFDRLIKTAPTAYDAIMQTGAQRLRPVFLTTATTALGLLPMACMLSIDFLTREITFQAPATLWWQQLAVSIVFGLLFATVLTLLFTPAALMLRYRRRDKKRARETQAQELPGVLDVPAE